MFDIALLGCGGTMPMPNRYLSSALLKYNGSMLLIDCGEGTQVSLKMLGWGFKAIDVICLTHYHADHVLGLPGLLLTIGNSGRTEPFTIIGPLGLKKVIEGLTVIAPNLPFELNLIEIFFETNTVHNIGDFIIKTLPGEHGVPCECYSIEVLRRPKFNKNRAAEQNIPISFWNRLQKGEIIYDEGKEYTPNMVLGEYRRGLKVSYCTDTRPVPDLSHFVSESDLFICEGMYGEDTELPKALENKHMLFTEAAKTAKEGSVKELWLTHYSPSLTEPSEYIQNAETIFSNTFIGEDRMVKVLNFENE